MDRNNTGEKNKGYEDSGMDRKLMMANGNKDPIKVLLWGWMGEYNRGINRLHRLEEENIIYSW